MRRVIITKWNGSKNISVEGVFHQWVVLSFPSDKSTISVVYGLVERSNGKMEQVLIDNIKFIHE